MTTSMVDWTVALNTATSWSSPARKSPRRCRGSRRRAAQLRQPAYVREVTGMEAASSTAPVLVVDRPRWIQANLDGFRQILMPLNAKMIDG